MSESTSFKMGDQVIHSAFGVGTITQVGAHDQVFVRFDRGAFWLPTSHLKPADREVVFVELKPKLPN